MSELSNINFDTLTTQEFERYLPELFAGGGGKVSEDPRLAKFLAANPDAGNLVRDLEAIAAAAKNLFEPAEDAEDTEASDSLWSSIASKLGQPDPDDPGLEPAS